MKNLVFIIIVTFSLYTILEVPSSSADVSEKDSYEYTFPYERSGWSGDLKHSGAKCYQCHFSLLEKERAMGIGCNCHYLSNNRWDLQVDIQEIQIVHGNSPCIRCHVGIVEKIEVDDIHTLHGNKPCESCHLENERLIRPNTIDCSVCHPYGPHGSHEDISSLCVLCHGEYGLSFSSESDSYIESGLKTSSNISSMPQREAGGIPTIADVIGFIFSSLLRR